MLTFAYVPGASRTVSPALAVARAARRPDVDVTVVVVTLIS
jgi:hypothetical protein